MTDQTSRFDAANLDICNLGEAAFAADGPRHAGLNPAAMAIIETFGSAAERATLVIAYMDSWDIAADRAVTEADLGVTQALAA